MSVIDSFSNSVWLSISVLQLGQTKVGHNLNVLAAGLARSKNQQFCVRLILLLHSSPTRYLIYVYFAILAKSFHANLYPSKAKKEKIGNFMVGNSYLVTIPVCFRSEGKLLDLLQSIAI